MKMKKRFKQNKRQIIQLYNYNIKCYGSFRNFQERLERDREQKELKLRHMKHYKKKIIAENTNIQVIFFELLNKCYLWNKKSGKLQKLPKNTAEDKYLAYSYLHVPPL